MGRACGTRGGEYIYIYIYIYIYKGFGMQPWRTETRVNWKIILKSILKKYDGRAWSEFI